MPRGQHKNTVAAMLESDNPTTADHEKHSVAAAQTNPLKKSLETQTHSGSK